MLVYIHGPQEACRVLYERIGEFERRQEAALRKLPQALQDAYRRKEAESYEEFGEGAKKWVFPSPILDEGAWRKQHTQEWDQDDG